MVTLNGEKKNLAGRNLHEVLVEEGYEINRVVVERNLEIVPIDLLQQIVLQDEDTIEVLRFVGGG